MKNILMDLYDLLRPIIPLLLLLMGSLGFIYSVATSSPNDFLKLFSLMVLISGISIYTYQQAVKSELFKKRFGLKSKSDSSRHRRKTGKRCPRCERVIYHRRTICHHCGYEYPSHHKDSDDSGESESTDATT